jgi:hypothetical protein
MMKSVWKLKRAVIGTLMIRSTSICAQKSFDKLSASRRCCFGSDLLSVCVIILSLLMLGFSPRCSFAAPSGGVTKAAAQASSIDLHFPSHPVGKIYKVEVLKNGLTTRPTVGDKSWIARGDISLDPAQAILFTMNYAGSENSSFLEGMSNANVVVLDMNNLENVNDETFKHISKLTQLRRILSNGTDLSDEGMKYLKPLKNLSTLVANGSLIKGPGLSVLAELPELRYLELARSAMRGCDFSKLAPLKKIVAIDLSGCALTDTVCMYLNQMHTMIFLNIAKNKITDEGISHLVNLNHLTEINLINTAVTPRAALSLAKLPMLQHVILGENQFSEPAVLRFKKALPKCSVELRKSDDKIDANVFAPLR